MKPKTGFALFRFTYFFLFFFITIGGGWIIIDVLIIPLLGLVFYNIPYSYTWPTLHKFIRALITVLAMAFFGGGLLWLNEQLIIRQIKNGRLRKK